jgi:hypothetical protein
VQSRKIQSPPSRRRDTPFQKSKSHGHGSEVKDDCAGEGSHNIIALLAASQYVRSGRPGFDTQQKQ